jgi:hypothetical protein
MYKLFMFLEEKDPKKALLESVFNAKTYFKRQDVQKPHISPPKKNKFGLAKKYNFTEGYLETYYPTDKKAELIKNAPEYMLENEKNIYFVINLEKPTKKELLKAKEKWDTYHAKAFLKKGDKPKTVHCVIIIKNKQYSSFVKLLKKIVPKKEQSSFFERIVTFELEKEKGFSFVIGNLFYYFYRQKAFL